MSGHLSRVPGLVMDLSVRSMASANANSVNYGDQHSVAEREETQGPVSLTAVAVQCKSNVPGVSASTSPTAVSVPGGNCCVARSGCCCS